MDKSLIKSQFFNYIIYTTLAGLYALLDEGGAGTFGILFFPVILFTVLVFLYNMSFTFLGQFIFGCRRYLVWSLLTPQIIAFLLFGSIKLNSVYIIDRDFDPFLYGFLIVTGILNVLTFFRIKGKIGVQ